MEALKKKTEQVIIRRSNNTDIKKILDFHQKQFPFSQPVYLKNTLECYSGTSVIASHQNEIIGHILLFPLTSRYAIGIENVAFITGIWSTDEEITHLLIKEAIMCSWESGFHAIFCFEEHAQLKEHGFEKSDDKFFAFDTSNYLVYGMELSWKGFDLIPNDLTIPQTFLPPIKKLNHFSKN